MIPTGAARKTLRRLVPHSFLLHQWNLDAVDGDLTIKNQGQRHALNDLLPTAEYVHHIALAGPVLTAVAHRRRPGGEQ